MYIQDHSSAYMYNQTIPNHFVVHEKSLAYTAPFCNVKKIETILKS